MFSRRWLEIVAMILVGLGLAVYYGLVRVPPGQVAVTETGDRADVRWPSTQLVPRFGTAEGSLAVTTPAGAPLSLRWSVAWDLAGAGADVLRQARDAGSDATMMALVADAVEAAWREHPATDASPASLAPVEGAVRATLQARGVVVRTLTLGAS